MNIMDSTKDILVENEEPNNITISDMGQKHDQASSPDRTTEVSMVDDLSCIIDLNLTERECCDQSFECPSSMVINISSDLEFSNLTAEVPQPDTKSSITVAEPELNKSANVQHDQTFDKVIDLSSSLEEDSMNETSEQVADPSRMNCTFVAKSVSNKSKIIDEKVEPLSVVSNEAKTDGEEDHTTAIVNVGHIKISQFHCTQEDIISTYGECREGLDERLLDNSPDEDSDDSIAGMMKAVLNYSNPSSPSAESGSNKSEIIDEPVEPLHVLSNEAKTTAEEDDAKKTINVGNIKNSQFQVSQELLDNSADEDSDDSIAGMMKAVLNYSNPSSPSAESGSNKSEIIDDHVEPLHVLSNEAKTTAEEDDAKKTINVGNIKISQFQCTQEDIISTYGECREGLDERLLDNSPDEDSDDSIAGMMKAVLNYSNPSSPSAESGSNKSEIIDEHVEPLHVLSNEAKTKTEEDDAKRTINVGNIKNSHFQVSQELLDKSSDEDSDDSIAGMMKAELNYSNPSSPSAESGSNKSEIIDDHVEPLHVLSNEAKTTAEEDDAKKTINVGNIKIRQFQVSQELLDNSSDEDSDDSIAGMMKAELNYSNPSSPSAESGSNKSEIIDDHVEPLHVLSNEAKTTAEEDDAKKTINVGNIKINQFQVSQELLDNSLDEDSDDSIAAMMKAELNYSNPGSPSAESGSNKSEIIDEHVEPLHVLSNEAKTTAEEDDAKKTINVGKIKISPLQPSQEVFYNPNDLDIIRAIEHSNAVNSSTESVSNKPEIIIDEEAAQPSVNVNESEEKPEDAVVEISLIDVDDTKINECEDPQEETQQPDHFNLDATLPIGEIPKNSENAAVHADSFYDVSCNSDASGSCVEAQIPMPGCSLGAVPKRFSELGNVTPFSPSNLVAAFENLKINSTADETFVSCVSGDSLVVETNSDSHSDTMDDISNSEFETEDDINVEVVNENINTEASEDNQTTNVENVGESHVSLTDPVDDVVTQPEVGGESSKINTSTNDGPILENQGANDTPDNVLISRKSLGFTLSNMPFVSTPPPVKKQLKCVEDQLHCEAFTASPSVSDEKLSKYLVYLSLKSEKNSIQQEIAKLTLDLKKKEGQMIELYQHKVRPSEYVKPGIIDAETASEHAQAEEVMELLGEKRELLENLHKTKEELGTLKEKLSATEREKAILKQENMSLKKSLDAADATLSEFVFKYERTFQEEKAKRAVIVCNFEDILDKYRQNKALLIKMEATYKANVEKLQTQNAEFRKNYEMFKSSALQQIAEANKENERIKLGTKKSDLKKGVLKEN